ncbi:MAG: hypothetical protein EOO07_20955 [Chitinophagaceae bacterium]|nr:MAG: hypothetical protein EOO07_20955 [Chitinophagaceae bacterium]
MAKTSGIVNFEGTVEDLTFYKRNGKTLVRRKGGISGERIKTEPNFVRTRENNSEFGHCCTSSKVLRLAMGTLVHKAKDGKLSNRLMQMLTRAKNMDSTSKRGLRKVGIGIMTPSGRQLFNGFDFNKNAPLQSVLFAPYDVDTVNGMVAIADFVPAEQLHFPEGATHVSLQSGVAIVDFLTEDSNLSLSPALTLPIDLTVT